MFYIHGGQRSRPVNLSLAGLIIGSFVEVPSGKTLNPSLLLVVNLAPYMRDAFISVWMCVNELLFKKIQQAP